MNNSRIGGPKTTVPTPKITQKTQTKSEAAVSKHLGQETTAPSSVKDTHNVTQVKEPDSFTTKVLNFFLYLLSLISISKKTTTVAKQVIPTTRSKGNQQTNIAKGGVGGPETQESSQTLKGRVVVAPETKQTDKANKVMTEVPKPLVKGTADTSKSAALKGTRKSQKKSTPTTEPKSNKPEEKTVPQTTSVKPQGKPTVSTSKPTTTTNTKGKQESLPNASTVEVTPKLLEKYKAMKPIDAKTELTKHLDSFNVDEVSTEDIKAFKLELAAAKAAHPNSSALQRQFGLMESVLIACEDKTEPQKGEAEFIQGMHSALKALKIPAKHTQEGLREAASTASGVLIKKVRDSVQTGKNQDLGDLTKSFVDQQLETFPSDALALRFGTLIRNTGLSLPQKAKLETNLVTLFSHAKGPMSTYTDDIKAKFLGTTPEGIRAKLLLSPKDFTEQLKTHLNPKKSA